MFSKALRQLKVWEQPRSINTNRNPAYTKAISDLKKEGKIPLDLDHRQVKYLNNIIESDHEKLKRLIKPTLGFKSMKTAFAIPFYPTLTLGSFRKVTGSVEYYIKNNLNLPVVN